MYRRSYRGFKEMTAIRHIGLVVSNLDRMIDFYCEVFGFCLTVRVLETGPYIEALVGLPGVRIELAKLADANGLFLELLRYHSHPEEPMFPQVQRHGCSHMALTVTDIRATLKRLEAFGGKAGQLQRNPEKTVLVAYARDPEGILLELVQNL
jgi:catechol 2,3-dioxygenase-like lactoylglutathione lyase family enzyme